MPELENGALAAPSAEPVADPASAPATPAEPVADPAPASSTDEPVVTDGEPTREEQPKVVRELITQRRKRQEAERRIAELEAERQYFKGLADGRGKGEDPPRVENPSEPQVPVAPQLDQFETYAEYEAAKDDFLVRKAKFEFAQEQKAAEQRRYAMSAEEKYQKRLSDAAKEDPEILDVAASLRVSPIMATLVKESDHAVALIRWMDQHAEETARIAGMTPLQAAREIGIIEARLSYAPKPEAPKKVSSAPEPVKPVSTSSPAPVDEDDLPMEEYHKRRTQQMFGR